MMQNAEPIGHEEEISVSKDTVISDEWPSRPAHCVRSPRSTSVFGLNGRGICCAEKRPRARRPCRSIPHGL